VASGDSMGVRGRGELSHRETRSRPSGCDREGGSSGQQTRCCQRDAEVSVWTRKPARGCPPRFFFFRLHEDSMTGDSIESEGMRRPPAFVQFAAFVLIRDFWLLISMRKQMGYAGGLSHHETRSRPSGCAFLPQPIYTDCSLDCRASRKNR